MKFAKYSYVMVDLNQGSAKIMVWISCGGRKMADTDIIASFYAYYFLADFN